MTWLPKNNQLQFATAITNTAAVNTMPDRIRKSLEDFSAPAETIYRLETLVKNAYIGDAVQVMAWDKVFKYINLSHLCRIYYQEILECPTSDGMQWSPR